MGGGDLQMSSPSYTSNIECSLRSVEVLNDSRGARDSGGLYRYFKKELQSIVISSVTCQGSQKINPSSGEVSHACWCFGAPGAASDGV